MLALAGAASAATRPEMAPDNTRQCISRHAIRDETTESDQKLIFHVGGGQAYRNYLPQSCDGLRGINNVNKLRLHSADPDKLCVGDTAQVAGHDGSLLGVFGGGESRTTSCRLGQFEPISEMSLSEELRR